MKPRLRAEWAVSSEEEIILASCCLSPIRRNSVLDELRVKGDMQRYLTKLTESYFQLLTIIQSRLHNKF